MKETLVKNPKNSQQPSAYLIGQDVLIAKDRLSVAKWGWITLRIGRAKRWWRRKGKHSVRNRYRMVYAILSSFSGARDKAE